VVAELRRHGIGEG